MEVRGLKITVKFDSAFSQAFFRRFLSKLFQETNGILRAEELVWNNQTMERLYIAKDGQTFDLFSVFTPTYLAFCENNGIIVTPVL